MAADSAQLPRQPLVGTLLCIDVPAPFLETVKSAGIRITGNHLPHALTPDTRLALSAADVVLLDVTNGGQGTIDVVQRLRNAVCVVGASCRILCFSLSHRNPRFILELEKCGARFARIGSPAMLLEALELIFTEISSIESNGPCFGILHRFSHGLCAPGEEIAAVWLQNREPIQLPLSLSGRFVFDYLGRNRSIALDALQIVAGLTGWFYRNHSLNSGLKQTTKVRVATVRVIVQRIRQAMATALAKVGLVCDPYDVLRSFYAEGSGRALYKLHAHIEWEHREN